MCCQPYIKASINNIYNALFLIGYFLSQYFLNNKYYIDDLCLSPYVMLSIAIVYFIIGVTSFFIINNSKFLFVYGLYIFNLCVSIIGLLHFAVCAIPVNVISNASYEFLYFFPPVSIYIVQLVCYLFFIKWIKNIIYEEIRTTPYRNSQRIEMYRVELRYPRNTTASIAEQ